eukprot:1142672-Pelagomonas_calceolata.AAC.10
MPVSTPSMWPRRKRWPLLNQYFFFLWHGTACLFHLAAHDAQQRAAGHAMHISRGNILYNLCAFMHWLACQPHLAAHGAQQGSAGHAAAASCLFYCVLCLPVGMRRPASSSLPPMMRSESQQAMLRAAAASTSFLLCALFTCGHGTACQLQLAAHDAQRRAAGHVAHGSRQHVSHRAPAQRVDGDGGDGGAQERLHVGSANAVIYFVLGVLPMASSQIYCVPDILCARYTVCQTLYGTCQLYLHTLPNRVLVKPKAAQAEGVAQLQSH